MKIITTLWKRLLTRIAWMLLKAAEFDLICLELMEYCEKLQDPAAMIPRRFSEFQGALGRLETCLDGLEQRIEALEDIPAPAPAWHSSTLNVSGPVVA